MRTLLTVTMGTEAGNRAIKDGTLPQVMETFLRDHKPEAAYFTAQNGQRTAFFVLDLPDPAAIPSVAEPFFMVLNAQVDFRPVMNAEDLRAGLQRVAR